MSKAYQIVAFIFLFLPKPGLCQDAIGSGKITQDPAGQQLSIQVKNVESVSNEGTNFTTKLIKKKARARVTEFHLPYVSNNFADQCEYSIRVASALHDPQLNSPRKSDKERGPPSLV
jgi:hypothetical protein